jgi:hypothetical protein
MCVIEHWGDFESVANYGFKIRSLKLLTLPLLPLFGLYGNSEMSFVFRV